MQVGGRGFGIEHGEEQGKARALPVFGTEKVWVEVVNEGRLVKSQESSGLEVPSIRVARASREDLTLS